MNEEEFQQFVQEQVTLAFQLKADFYETYDGLIVTAERLIEAEMDPSLELLTTYGALLSDRGRHLDAFQILERVVERKPGFREAYFNFAVTLMNLESGRSRAEEFFQIAQQYPSSNALEAYIDFHGH